MACPSGCLNGGAQIRSQSNLTAKELTVQLEELYSSLPCKNPSDNEAVKELYEKWLEGSNSDKAANILHTKYHAVEKFINALNIKW
ncbi:hypothetical protein HHI36_008683 [Cryptolaemus montrouzieri]|uniref:Iron hydrogenase small subunit domain-containing protein n=1 Tax=Cryptolaemus montrouzieri TaxID=559131 RepID=A0ABD2MT49_9CUCU